MMMAYKKEASLKNETSFLYAVRSRQRIHKNTDLGRSEGEKDKEQGDHEKRRNCRFWCPAGLFAAVQPECFANIDRCGGNEENGNVDPIG